MDSPVVIVGRGPVGMTTALLLAHYRVPSVVIDPMPSDKVLPGSKAVLIAGHVIAITGPIGVGQLIADEGLAWAVSRTFIRGKEVTTTDVSTTQGLLPKIVNLPQKRVEELLLERLHAEPLITLISESEVVDFYETENGVNVSVDTPSGTKMLMTSWLIGCDGSKSTVRKKLGLIFEGYGHDENFLIVDIKADLPFPNERHFHFDPEFNPGRTVLIHPQPDSTWHIDWQVGPEIDAEDEKSSGKLDKRIRGVIGDIDYELYWLTTYQFKQLKARHFRQGRCFLVGDAAHLTSPYGARGMNSGIADAENLAWRLAMVVRDEATESLLDGYGIEREYASRENLEITGATARFMCPRTYRERLVRRATLELARIFPPARRCINSGTFYEAVTYPPAMLDDISESDTDLPVGSLAPDGLVSSIDPTITRLGQMFRKGFVLLIFPGHDHMRTDRVVQDVLKKVPFGFMCTAVEVIRGIPSDKGSDRHIQVQDTDGALHATWVPYADLSEGYVYILRPDAYIAARSVLDADMIANVITSIVKRQTINNG